MVFTPLCRMERSLRHDPCLSCYRRRRFGIGSRGVFGRVHPAVLNPSFSSLLPIGLPERFAPAAFAFAKRPLPGKGQMKRAWKHASRPFSFAPCRGVAAWQKQRPPERTAPAARSVEEKKKRGSKRQDGHDRKHRESQCQNGGGGSKISTGHDGGSFPFCTAG